MYPDLDMFAPSNLLYEEAFDQETRDELGFFKRLEPVPCVRPQSMISLDLRVIEENIVEPMGEPETSRCSNEMTDLIDTAIRSLAENEQTVIRALFFEGKNPRRIAQEQGCNVRAVIRSKNKALRFLGNIIKKRMVN